MRGRLFVGVLVLVVGSLLLGTAVPDLLFDRYFETDLDTSRRLVALNGVSFDEGDYLVWVDDFGTFDQWAIDVSVWEDEFADTSLGGDFQEEYRTKTIDGVEYYIATGFQIPEDGRYLIEVSIEPDIVDRRTSHMIIQKEPGPVTVVLFSLGFILVVLGAIFTLIARERARVQTER